MENSAKPALLLLLLLSLGSCYAAVMPGGKQPISDSEAKSPGFLNALQAATKRFNSFSNSMMHSAILRYEDAKQQVVSGIMYDFVAVFAETSCRKSPDSYHKPLASCPKKPKQNAIVHRCHMKVWYQAWRKENKYQVMQQRCQQQHKLSKRSVQHHVLLGGDSHDVGHFGQFLEFKRRFSRVYASEREEQQRFRIFHDNMKKARAYQMLDLGDATYGASQFADMTEEEFRKFYLTPNWDLSRRPREDSRPLPVDDLPDSFDWRQKGAVTDVKNQGSCGSCWAFSTTGNIEGQWFLRKKELVSLSEQELVDCDKVDEGCNGGLPSQAYKEIQRLGGLMSEKLYPYKGRNAKCQFEKSKVAAYVNGSVSIPKDEKQIAAWLVKNGPISIGINANAMQFYLGGVSHPWKIFCNPGHLDHGVLIVGFGKRGTEPYWIVKNSWGAGWGDKGYYLVYRGDGTCGLNQMCTSAVVR